MQFRNPTDGTRGLRRRCGARFPAGALAPTTVLVERSDGAVRPPTSPLVHAPASGGPGVAAVSDVAAPLDATDAARALATFTDDPYGLRAFERVDRCGAPSATCGPACTVLLGDGTAQQVDFKRACEPRHRR